MGVEQSPRQESGLRINRVSGEMAIVAPHREGRPRDMDSAGDAVGPANECPFCDGRESETPPEVDAVRPPGSAPDSPGWRMRAFPNRYPALPRRHEVIVHSPEHGAELEDLDDEQLADVLRLWQRRLTAQFDDGAEAALLVANRGPGSGASLTHPHEQLLALPVVPPLLLEEVANFERYRNRYGGCLLCDELTRAGAWLEHQAEGRERLVFGGDFSAWVPEAPRFTIELWLAPTVHEAAFKHADVAALGPALRRALSALRAVSDGAPTNLWLHTAPARHRGVFHWHFEMAARTSDPASFELGGGISIVSRSPEAAAESLRAAAAR
jgi:UDPglucose--hexose-1-phosphate uridylyltransferase